ncbi:hypothetical protein ACKWTF_014963 [Chironomus riparius]
MGNEVDKYVIEQRCVFIRTCDVARIFLASKLKNGKFVSDYNYLLQKELTWKFIELEANYLNPFITCLQYYIDLSLSSSWTASHVEGVCINWLLRCAAFSNSR